MKRQKINKENNHCKPHTLELAINEFVKRGGIIETSSQKEPSRNNCKKSEVTEKTTETMEDYTQKVELLKDLITKGAGIYALQYSLKMNKDEIKRMAREQGLKITHRRPLCPARKYRPLQPVSADTRDDDVIAGHAMHYAALGYTAPEIAQTLELSVRQVWELARTYRFELRHRREGRMD
ncbi:hypothetical protein [Pseudomonas vanderleydeniana]|uniref:Uncharacterized protein n=1 Tax=Pseudomonas vanderleydeniana TaxID=2745495 RepID=A0A9E6PIS7_9PSED|nr:hypothetical protein [Pseudomonas vanderleydeniana]QXI27487.1 hypothetical protein HU752_026860 [Pseudomonas vanderleydeniana]